MELMNQGGEPRATQDETRRLRLAIFGATGGTGAELARLAMAHGHDVRALVRSPKRLRLVNNGHLRVVLGNALDREAVSQTLLGTDAALVCLGQGGNVWHNTRAVSGGVAQILAVMQTTGARRIVVESAFGAGESWAQAAWSVRVMIRTLLRVPYAEKNRMEPELRRSGLDWTILRPTWLTHEAATGHFVVTSEPPLQWKISRADVAQAMLQAVEENLWVREARTLSGG